MNLLMAAIQHAHRTSRKMKITFKPDAVAAVKIICGKNQAGIVRIIEPSAQTLTKIMGEKKWLNDGNRTMEVKEGVGFNDQKFAEFANLYLENVSVVI